MSQKEGQGQWLKIIGGSLLIALGVFSLMEAFIFRWKLYTLRQLRGTTILENVPLLIFIGVPSVIIGIILVIKGTQELLSR